jgi:hypothetical protein
MVMPSSAVFFRFSCPVCLRSSCDMSHAWQKLDQEVQKVPPLVTQLISSKKSLYPGHAADPVIPLVTNILSGCSLTDASNLPEEEGKSTCITAENRVSVPNSMLHSSAKQLHFGRSRYGSFATTAGRRRTCSSTFWGTSAPDAALTTPGRREGTRLRTQEPDAVK